MACCNRVLNFLKNLTCLTRQHTNKHNVRLHNDSLIIELCNHTILLREWSQKMGLAGTDKHSQIIEAGLCLQQLGQDACADLAAPDDTHSVVGQVRLCRAHSVLGSILLMLVHKIVLILHQVIVNRGYVDALEHDGVADNFRQYELLL